jgi:glycosyltransferase involved in cell wall biosynthesis
LLAHGGLQVQIEQTIAAIPAIGVETEHLRWGDGSQQGDVIHFIGRPLRDYIQFARGKGIRVVICPLLSGPGSRPAPALWLQKRIIAAWRRVMPAMLTTPFGWDSFKTADACIANTAWEAHLMTYIFGAPPDRVHVVPNGVEDVFFRSSPTARGPWLVCSATITERKRVLELAQAAVTAQTPLWIIGKPYAEADPYARRFLAFAKAHASVIRYEGPIQARNQLAEVYRQARGFVLLSTVETRSLSSEEAAASECPLLLSDLPWARSTFQDHAAYCPIASTPRTAAELRKFYDAAPGLQPPPKPLSWIEVARQFKQVYEHVLTGPGRNSACAPARVKDSLNEPR